VADRLESCCSCGEHTGRAGASEDSIYAGDAGPFCETCWNDIMTWVETDRDVELVCEQNRAKELDAEIERLREHLGRLLEILDQADWSESVDGQHARWVDAAKAAGVMDLLDTNAVVRIPPNVRVCPYCGGTLSASFTAWTQEDDGSWSAEEIDLECDTMPDLAEDNPSSLEAWDEWHARHSYMPYVYWLPVTVAVLRWINRRYRFRVAAQAAGGEDERQTART